MTRINLRKTQAGAVLFMAMIFLVLITVMAVTMFTVSRNTAQVVNNINLRKLSFQAANQTSDVAMSTYKVVSDPAHVLPNGTDIVDVDINGDGKTVINTEVKPPSCNKGQPKENLNLDLNDPVQAGCANSISTGQKCYDITFQYPVVAKEKVFGSYGSGAQNTVTQGASIIVPAAGAFNVCHGAGGVLYF